MSEAPKKWKPNVFVLGFVFGAIVLTVLPFLQKRFLKAPAPIRTLPAWSLVTSTGELVGSDQLKGRVWMASFRSSPCDEECLARQQTFGSTWQHVEDLDGGVTLVTFSGDAPGVSQHGWYVLGGDAEPQVLEEFRQGWIGWAGTDAGSTPQEFARLPGFAVVDQSGALRGFWKDDPEGRGNAINAARLLLRYGSKP